MSQLSFGDMEYTNRRRKTKRELFLEQMDKIIPWADWVDMITAYYPSGKRGRPPIGIETMLRMYLMQNWFSLSDEGIEDAVYDSHAMRSFLRINFLEQQVPDATTVLHFRHLLEEHALGKALFDDIRNRLDKAGLIMHGGSVVDATLISAPSSTKNQTGERDPEMHSTKKGNQWHFGMKVHAGVDAGSGYVHTITGTAANVHDVTQAHALIRDDDEVGYGDSGYLGVEKRSEIRDDEHLSKVDFRINKRPSSIKATGIGKVFEKYLERRKSSTRSKVEHVFQIVKRYFGCHKTAYRGIAKNMNKFFVLFGCANLVMCIRAGRAEEFTDCWA